jgi:uncharacterized membrane protein YedE/YeeE
MKLLISFFTGLLFSIGLSVSGMVNPDKVIGFLDITGDWDPALMFVMAGGVILNFILFKFILRRKNPIYMDEFTMPTSTDVDWRLVTGSAIFGIGWGLAGVCPGPGIANLFLLQTEMIAFVGAMIGGMLIFKMVNPLLNK